MAPAPGTVIGGRYRLERRIASGGMASVWEAHDEVLARQVAVKVLHPHLGADEQFVARFKREAIAAARLTHPSIVAIYDTCAEGGTEAIVMELVRGPTLRAELDRRGTFAPADAVHVVAEVADALAAAHAAGIVHRDVKPANVLLAPGGRVLVADFGIARAGDGLELTGTGTTLGTVKYLAPEQVDPSRGPVDGRADVYAAGVLLYELLAGTAPFVAETDAATALARLHQDPATAPLDAAGVDPELAAIVSRALARDPAQRWSGAAELRDALRAWASGSASGPPTAPVPVVTASPPPTAAVDPTGVVPVDGTQVVPTPVAAAPVAAAAPAAPAARRKPRRWAPIVLGSIVGAAVLVVVALWVSAGGDGDDGDIDTPVVTAGTDGLAISDVTSFDPEGDGSEGEDRVGRAVDDDPASFWRSECYSSPTFGNLKGGVGIVAELSGRSEVSEVVVSSPATGWAAQVYVADAPSDDLPGWGDPVAEGGGDTTSTFDAGGAEGQYVLVWFTALGPEPLGDCESRPYGVAVTELSVV